MIRDVLAVLSAALADPDTGLAARAGILAGGLTNIRTDYFFQRWLLSGQMKMAGAPNVAIAPSTGAAKLMLPQESQRDAEWLVDIYYETFEADPDIIADNVTITLAAVMRVLDTLVEYSEAHDIGNTKILLVREPVSIRMGQFPGAGASPSITTNGFTVTAAITERETPLTLGAWRGHEPPGFRQLNARPFSVLQTVAPYNQDGGTYWRDFVDTGVGVCMDIVDDPTATRSPPKVMRIRYPVNLPVGDSPARSFTWDSNVVPPATWAVKKLYVCLRWKCSPNWWGCNTSANKILYAYTQNTGQIMHLSAVGNGVAQLGVIIQGALAGNGVYVPPPGEGIITRGEWCQPELLWIANSAGAADGSCEVWLNGIKILTILNVQLEAIAALFSAVGLDGVWSGGDAVPAEQFYYHDEVYVSGSD